MYLGCTSVVNVQVHVGVVCVSPPCRLRQRIQFSRRFMEALPVNFTNFLREDGHRKSRSFDGASHLPREPRCRRAGSRTTRTMKTSCHHSFLMPRSFKNQVLVHLYLWRCWQETRAYNYDVCLLLKELDEKVATCTFLTRYRPHSFYSGTNRLCRCQARERAC